MNVSPLAGKLPPASALVDVSQLIGSYYAQHPDFSVKAHRVSFGTSGHRGSSCTTSFNEDHILAITQAICLYRQAQKINGPLFLGIDTHALSRPAYQTALEVLAANGVEVRVAADDGYTPTPAISHAILVHNRNRTEYLADGIVITPSHNPPQDGGIKYNPPSGGPAGSETTNWIAAKANEFLQDKLHGINRVAFDKAVKATSTQPHDYCSAYCADLSSVIDFDLIKKSKIKMAVDPLGGAGVHYWAPLAERFGLDLTVLSEVVDPTFRFMSVDWDGQIRMDPSSSFAMQSVIGMKDRFDVAFACDTDHDRHGIVTKSVGLLPPNHYLAVCIWYLFQHRPEWKAGSAVGKTLVSSQMIDRVCKKIGRPVYEVPVGFKWFVEGLQEGTLGFVGEESAGASFLRKSGEVWTTDKDGIIAALLSAEILAATGKDPGAVYADLTAEFGSPLYERVEAAATPEQKQKLIKLSPQQVTSAELAGEKIVQILTSAPGNGAAIGGVKVIAESGWFAARPSGTENIYKIYAESFRGKDHLAQLITDAQKVVSLALQD